MATETLRPDAAGDECNIEDEKSIACPNHYQEVDEAVSDEFGTYIYSGAADWERDLYNLADSGVGVGDINFIKVYALCNGTNSSSQTCGNVAIKSGTGSGNPDTTDEGTAVTIKGVWLSISNQWNTNPATSAAWAWTEIDKLQAGVVLREAGAATGWQNFCTQVYVEVDYEAIITFIPTVMII